MFSAQVVSFLPIVVPLGLMVCVAFFCGAKPENSDG